MQEIADERLITGCLGGDGSCWEALYRRYYGQVRRVAAWPRWHFSQGEVEDCVQDVFIELIRSLPKFRGEASLSTFVVRLTKNRCVSLIRRKTAQKRVREEVGYVLEERKGTTDEPIALAVADGPGPDEEYLAQEEAGAILEGLGQLNEDCQVILRLRYYEDRSYHEICDSLSLPLGTVCSRLKRCLERLRKVLAA